MTLVDSSVWIDYLQARVNAETRMLNSLLTSDKIAIGDLILVEVLQGCRTDENIQYVRMRLAQLPVISLCGAEIAVQSARNYLWLRERGITVRKTIDTIIATRCIESGYKLLHRDRDFEPFMEFLGLQSAI